jgi:hypothetical protein
MFMIGCAPMSVQSYAARGQRFGEYRTYAWAHDGDRATGDPRFDNNRMLEDRVREDVDRELARRGLEKGVNTPELLVHFYASFSHDIDGNGAGQSRCDTCQPFSYEAGTLLLDFVDAGTGQLVWRGWAEGRVDGVTGKQEWMEEEIDRAISRILAQLPARG